MNAMKRFLGGFSILSRRLCKTILKEGMTLLRTVSAIVRRR